MKAFPENQDSLPITKNERKFRIWKKSSKKTNYLITILAYLFLIAYILLISGIFNFKFSLLAFSPLAVFSIVLLSYRLITYKYSKASHPKKVKWLKIFYLLISFLIAFGFCLGPLYSNWALILEVSLKFSVTLMFFFIFIIENIYKSQTPANWKMLSLFSFFIIATGVASIVFFIIIGNSDLMIPIIIYGSFSTLQIIVALFNNSNSILPFLSSFIWFLGDLLLGLSILIYPSFYIRPASVIFTEFISLNLSLVHHFIYTDNLVANDINFHTKSPAKLHKKELGTLLNGKK